MNTLINGRWTLDLPEWRATRPEWPWWERDRLAAMWAALRRDDLVFDIGAESGDLACLYASWGCRVVAVEPSRAVWPTIRDCCERNGVELAGRWCGFAAAEPRGAHVDWWDDPAPVDVAGFAHLDEQDDIPATTVDALANVFGPPDVLTIDVEGSELEVLKGAKATLDTLRPTVFVSVHPEFMWDRWHQSPDDLLVLMCEHHGYEAHRLAFDHEQHWMFRP